ncbi:hypothetical protein [Rhodococcus sp. Q]|uniref:hypothetical protein n=1 Tax=Rhodococcus sp. Q TaxID=2502252 RepID=UPI0010F49E1E|nr:hypothetical protein [Rhodococcus sp. Q]
MPDDDGISRFITERINHHAAQPCGSGFQADPQRTAVLERIAQWAGRDRCTLYRGNTTAEVIDIGGENVTDDYLVLAINRPAGGQDAVAISPAVGRHATFVVRHDVSHLPWRDVFALPKASARGLGAKRMQFKARWPMDPYEAMFEKVVTALECSTARFGEKFVYSDDLGAYLL